MSDLGETAFAKLNLALHVRRRRPDGYHDIETLFVFCEHGDRLHGQRAGALSLEVNGPFAADVPSGDGNVVNRAAAVLQQATGSAAGARLHLVKNLPVASGIGGGSADAAAALRLLTRLWGSERAAAERIAGSLGADVPACLLSRGCRGEGAGDRLEPVELGLAGTPVLLVNPGVPLSTAHVFERWDGIDHGPLGDWRDGRNDLEPAATALVPETAELLDWLRSQPRARFVRMSGSGATCFALFDGPGPRDTAASRVPRRWWHLATHLR